MGQPFPPPGRPPHGPLPPGRPAAYPPAPRPPRTGLTVAVTAAVTLAVAGLLTWVGFTAFVSPTQLRAAPGLPPDPCAEVGEEALDAIDGEFSSWRTGVHTNECTWTTSLGGQAGTLLVLTRSVPMSDADARVAEEFDEAGARDADALFRSTVDEARTLRDELDEATVVDTEEKDLDFGDEGVIVLTDVGYGSSLDDVVQRVHLVVREGDLVSSIRVDLLGGGEIDADEVEELLSDVATDIFG